MKTNTVSDFYSQYCSIVSSLIERINSFKRLKKSYDAVGLGSLITDGSDFGVSAQAHEELMPFFTELKGITTGFISDMNEHVASKVYYDSLDLGSSIGNDYEFGDGNEGSDLKAAITSMASLESDLIANYHYTNLCRMEYTAKRVGLSWTAGITGSQVESVVTSLAAVDTFLTSGFHYSNLNKLV